MYYGADPKGPSPRVLKVETVMVGPNEIPVEREHKVAHPMQPGAPMHDYMIDIETTGTNAQENAILQIAAVRFNRHTKEIDHKFFNRCLQVPPGRYWAEDTRDWWMQQNQDVLRNILSRAEPPEIVMRAFFDWVGEGPSIMPRAFWAKPISFDYVFVSSYLRQFGLMQPFHFREAVDLNSYLLGKGHENRREFWSTVEPVGEAHDALNDCLYQIRAIFQA